MSREHNMAKCGSTFATRSLRSRIRVPMIERRHWNVSLEVEVSWGVEWPVH
jgi:hypothetical protein